MKVSGIIYLSFTIACLHIDLNDLHRVVLEGDGVLIVVVGLVSICWSAAGAVGAGEVGIADGGIDGEGNVHLVVGVAAGGCEGDVGEGDAILVVEVVAVGGVVVRAKGVHARGHRELAGGADHRATLRKPYTGVLGTAEGGVAQGHVDRGGAAIFERHRLAIRVAGALQRAEELRAGDADGVGEALVGIVLAGGRLVEAGDDVHVLHVGEGLTGGSIEGGVVAIGAIRPGAGLALGARGEGLS